MIEAILPSWVFWSLIAFAAVGVVVLVIGTVCEDL